MFLVACLFVYRFFQCFCCVFIVLKPFCFKILGLFFVVFLFFIVVFFESIFYILTKALAEVEVELVVALGVVVTEGA